MALASGFLFLPCNQFASSLTGSFAATIPRNSTVLPRHGLVCFWTIGGLDLAVDGYILTSRLSVSLTTYEFTTGIAVFSHARLSEAPPIEYTPCLSPLHMTKCSSQNIHPFLRPSPFILAAHRPDSLLACRLYIRKHPKKHFVPNPR